MDKKQFSKSAAREVIDLLKKELTDCRDDVRSSMSRDVEESIKESKTRLTEIGVAIKQAQGLDGILPFLTGERIKEEKNLSQWRAQFKEESKSVHDSKELIRHLEHAISILKKEFGL